ncbi:MAG: FAD-binding oxidoreductase [Pseudobacteriovorax sp.]|nr:FAD-binding oxidoreductase [Pseudobacteriovorax sp.]
MTSTVANLYQQSWGKNIIAPPSEVTVPRWIDDIKIHGGDQSCLAFGLGRSYGDSCLNQDGHIFDMSRLNQIIHWDINDGLIHVHAGISIADLLSFVIPHGWFVPVTPGTKFVTLGGAIANDVHGKNHHRVGTIGRFIKTLTLLRSDGTILTCSTSQNVEVFRATIGGLGLTGIILTVELQLVFASSWIEVETIPFFGIEEFTNLSTESQSYEYTVAWIDCVDAWNPWGRGLFMRANHSPNDRKPPKQKPKLSVPINCPTYMLNRYSCKAFNEIYYRVNSRSVEKKMVHYDPFFYPLDAVHDWNRIYGKHGFYQYQFVVPFSEKDGVVEILNRISRSGFASFLAVLKTFGHQSSPGILSFPRPGYTLTLDLANRGQKTVKLLHELTEIVLEAKGRLYPAKDSVMTPRDFQSFYPEWEQFAPHRDKGFSSNFSRRVGVG